MTPERQDETVPEPSAAPPARRHGERLTWLAYLTRSLLAAGVLLVGLFVVVFLVSTKGETARSSPEAAAVLVETMTLDRVETPRVWEGFGTARAMESADVSAEVSGRVVERPARIEAGAGVEAGELLVRIEPLDYQQALEARESLVSAYEADLSTLEVEEARLTAQVRLAEEERQAAQRDHDRALEAQEAGAGSPGEVDRTLRALRQAERAVEALRQQLEVIPSRRARLEAQLGGERAQLRIDRENLARTSVRSPIAGVVQEVDAEVGEWVGASQRVARVVDLSRIEVPLRLPISALGSVGVGDRVELRPDGPAEAVWTGRIARIAPEGDRATRTVGVFVEVTQDASEPGAGRPLLPGQFVVGRVLTSRRSARVLAPRRAVVGDRLMVAEPIEPGDEALEGRADAASLRRVRAAEIRVDFYTSGTLPGKPRRDTEWAALEPAASVDPGAQVILTNLDQLVEGMIVSVRPVEGDGVARGTPESEPGAGGG